jgi:hypothetical protein
MKHTYFVRAIEGTMIESTNFAELPEGSFVPGEIRVELMNRAGSFWSAWKSPDHPHVGQRIDVEVGP